MCNALPSLSVSLTHSLSLSKKFKARCPSETLILFETLFYNEIYGFVTKHTKISFFLSHTHMHTLSHTHAHTHSLSKRNIYVCFVPHISISPQINESLSGMNESWLYENDAWPIWVSHGHIKMTHDPYEWVMATNEWVIVTYEWVMTLWDWLMTNMNLLQDQGL